MDVGAGLTEPVVDAEADGSFAAFPGTLSGVEVQVCVSPVSSSTAEISISSGLF